MDDPLDFIDFADVLQHGDPAKWRILGEKPGSGVAAHSASAPAGTRKIYEVYEDEFGVATKCIASGISMPASAV